MAAMAAMPPRQWRRKCSKSISSSRRKRRRNRKCKSKERLVQIDRRLISHFDWTLFLLSLAFVAVGVTTIYSANYDLAAGHAGPLPTRQLTWLGLGLIAMRSEEHTSELQSRENLVCRLLLEKKKKSHRLAGAQPHQQTILDL